MTSRWWSTASSSAKASRPASPTASRPRSSWPRASPISIRPTSPTPAGSERTGVAAALEAAAEREGFKLDYAPPGRITFSEKFACPVSGFTIAEIEPRLFSFNAPQGACPACDGLGEKLMFDEDLVVPNHALSITKGAVVPWAKSQPPSPYYMQVLGSLARAYDFDLDTPWGELPEEAQQRHPPRHRRPPGHACASSTAASAMRSRSRSKACIGNLEPPHAVDRKRLDARGA